MAFGSNPMSAGMALLNQVRGMQQPGQGQAPTDPINGGFIAKLMQGNPGGVLGALLNRRQAAPGQPGAAMEGPIAPGAPAMIPGGGLPPAGMLSRMFPMGQMPQMPQMPMGGSGALPVGSPFLG